MSYCVPFNLICNWKLDCPECHDEANCHSFSCSNLFKCKRQTKCVHFTKICDNHEDCLFGDDESWCINGSLLVCPKECNCLATSVVCKNLAKISDNLIWTSVKHFECFSLKIEVDSNIFSKFESIKFLNIKDYIFPTFCMNKDGFKPTQFFLGHLDLSLNRLIAIKDFCFSSLQSLIIFHLQHNQISKVEDKSFHLLMKLEVLNLSHNKIRKLKSNSFLGLTNIKVLNLKHNLIMLVPFDTFRKILPNTVHSFNIKVCCMSGSWSECKVIGDVFSNCDDLLSNNFIRYFCWKIGILTCLLNIITVVLHIYTKETQKNTLPLNYLA